MLRTITFSRVFAVVAFGLSVTPAAHAQSSDQMSAAEMTDAFNKQKTRGLVIVPSGQQTATDDTEETATVAAAASEYTAVAKEDQVNLQIGFDFDSAALREDQKPVLASLCKAMKAVDVSVFQIIGHTDSAGSANYNEKLSLLRAQEVKRYLVSDCGIEADRLNAIGMGETAPYNTADPRADENRRVEFQALG